MGEYLTLEADQVFKAIGQAFDPEPLRGSGIGMAKGRISADAEGRTTVEGIWAGGDCVAGGKDLTVASVEAGKVAAESIHATLMRRPQAVEGFAEAVLSGGAHHTTASSRDRNVPSDHWATTQLGNEQG